MTKVATKVIASCNGYQVIKTSHAGSTGWRTTTSCAGVPLGAAGSILNFVGQAGNGIQPRAKAAKFFHECLRQLRRLIDPG